MSKKARLARAFFVVLRTNFLGLEVAAAKQGRPCARLGRGCGEVDEWSYLAHYVDEAADQGNASSSDLESGQIFMVGWDNWH